MLRVKYHLSSQMVLLYVNVHKTLESCWYVLLARLQWTSTISVTSSRGTFPPFLASLSLIFFSLLPCSFIFSGAESSRQYPVLILNVILSQLCQFIFVLKGFPPGSHACWCYTQNNFECLIQNRTRQATRYSSFYVSPNNLNLLFLYDFFIFSHVW